MLVLQPTFFHRCLLCTVVAVVGAVLLPWCILLSGNFACLCVCGVEVAQDTLDGTTVSAQSTVRIGARITHVCACGLRCGSRFKALIFVVW